MFAEDLTVLEEGTAALLLRTDDADTPLADVDLTLALFATVFLTPEFDLVIAFVLLELFTLRTLLTPLFTLVNLALLIAVNPYGGHAYPPPKELNPPPKVLKPNPLLNELKPNPLLKELNPNADLPNGENVLNPVPNPTATPLAGLNSN